MKKNGLYNFLVNALANDGRGTKKRKGKKKTKGSQCTSQISQIPKKKHLSPIKSNLSAQFQLFKAQLYQTPQEKLMLGHAPNQSWGGKYQDPKTFNGSDIHSGKGPQIPSPCINQVRRRPFIGTCIDNVPENTVGMESCRGKKRRLSHHDRNENIKDSELIRYDDQQEQCLYGERQPSYQASYTDHWRNQPYTDDEFHLDVLPVEEKNTVSAHFRYEVSDRLNHQNENNKQNYNWTEDECRNGDQPPDTVDPNCFKMAILTHDYPATLFRWEQFDTIQMAVFEKLETTPDPVPVVNMGCINSQGAIPVTCIGEASLNFLRTFDGQVINNSLKLKVVAAEDLPKPVKLSWTSQNVICKDLKRVLRMLQRCNPGLRTALWKVLTTTIDGHIIKRIVDVDIVSAEYIRTKNYSIPDGLYRSVFKVFDMPKNKSMLNHSSDLNRQDQNNKNKQKKAETTVDKYTQSFVQNEQIFHPAQPSEGDPDCSLWEIREPVVTIDLTED